MHNLEGLGMAWFHITWVFQDCNYLIKWHLNTFCFCLYALLLLVPYLWNSHQHTMVAFKLPIVQVVPAGTAPNSPSAPLQPKSLHLHTEAIISSYKWLPFKFCSLLQGGKRTRQKVCCKMLRRQHLGATVLHGDMWNFLVSSSNLKS